MYTEHGKANVNTLSLNNVVSDDDGKDIEFIDTIPDDFDMEEHVLEKERRQTLLKAIKTLSEREKLLIRLYYGSSQLTQKQIAKIINTTQSNVSRLIIRTIAKLREIIKGEYYDK